MWCDEIFSKADVADEDQNARLLILDSYGVHLDYAEQFLVEFEEIVFIPAHATGFI